MINNKHKSDKSNVKYIDYLEEDDPIHGQSWYCVSFLSPEGIKNCSVRGLKMRGVFSTREEADKRAEYLQNLDPDFHVFVGEVGKWCPWDPDVNNIDDQRYAEEDLNDIMKGYKENLLRAKKIQAQRKKDMLKQTALEEQETQNNNKLTRAEKKRLNLRKKLEKKKAEQKFQNLAASQIKKESFDQQSNNTSNEIENRMENILKEECINKKLSKNQKRKKRRYKNKLSENKLFQKEDEIIKEERNRLNEQEKNITKQEYNISSVTDQIAHIQKIFNEIKKKDNAEQEKNLDQ